MESFTNAADQDRRYKYLVQQARTNQLNEVPTPTEITEFRAFKTSIGDADWRDVVDGWRKSGRKASITAEEMHSAYEKWQHERLKGHKLSKDVMRRNLKCTKEFANDHYGRKCKDLTKEGLIDWIESRYSTGPASPTFNRDLKTLRTMWDKSKEADNLFKEIETRNRPQTESTVRVLPIADAEKLFACGLKTVPWVMPRIALEAFMGLRFRSAALLKESHINCAEKGINLPAYLIKTGKDQYVEVIEENLWSWIRLGTPKTWALTERQYLTQKSRLFNNAGIPHPHNCFRHSACSYHAAAFAKPGLTASMLCHRNQMQLWDTYRGKATAVDGKRYYAITVESISLKLESGNLSLSN